jgi:hypothetical protein
MNAKAKGSRVEREIRKIFEKKGLKVVRSAGSLGSADLHVEGIGYIQVKARKEFQIYNWLEGNDAVVIKADRQEPLIVLPLERFLEWK